MLHQYIDLITPSTFGAERALLFLLEVRDSLPEGVLSASAEGGLPPSCALLLLWPLCSGGPCAVMDAPGVRMVLLPMRVVPSVGVPLPPARRGQQDAVSRLNAAALIRAGYAGAVLDGTPGVVIQGCGMSRLRVSGSSLQHMLPGCISHSNASGSALQLRLPGGRVWPAMQHAAGNATKLRRPQLILARADDVKLLTTISQRLPLRGKASRTCWLVQFVPSHLP
jgi:hypothetical protein